MNDRLLVSTIVVLLTTLLLFNVEDLTNMTQKTLTYIVAVLTAIVPQTIAQIPCANIQAEVGTGAQVRISDASSIAAQSINITGQSNIASLCRIKGSIPYGLNNTLGVELWLPEPWNGRFLAVGNGGLAGNIDYTAMLQRANSGYAVAAGDGGHLLEDNGNGTTAQECGFTTQSPLSPPLKQLTTLYYNKNPSYTYYAGCSTGGAQGFALAQWHPHLIDGIIAGCPGNFYSHLILSFLFNYNHANAAPNNASFLQQEKLDFITNATLDACDTLDGVADRIIENPLACTFNISSLACDGQTQSNGPAQCLTPVQLQTARAIYPGPTASGTQIYPGFDPGSESSWMHQQTFLATDYTYPILQNLVFKDLSYDPATFNFRGT